MPTTKQMIERYKELMETSKSCYLAGHEDLAAYLRSIDNHYRYINKYISAVYVFDFMKDRKFNELSDEVYNIYNEYRRVRATQSE